jgi:hypothetical protein
MSEMEQVIDQDLSERIRGRAYEIWIASGYRDGEADQHWLAAEQEILSGPRPWQRLPQSGSEAGQRLIDPGGGRTELQIAFRTLLSAAGFPHWFRS